ncbi:SH3 domain-containing protein [Allorhizobium taibaishanense]|uniref:SH3-like domain-containing protein n=1 Tax=Allorhizobium taibaishanense TaxID=887144 RepID=A0A7W6MTI5_9HYPH|nr:SH3 domain-containing protein [Allorhizobium taibaishanense]MBB4007098.1 SH3-like domain-containing protein [Allorhizobium taibaishanense]
MPGPAPRKPNPASAEDTRPYTRSSRVLALLAIPALLILTGSAAATPAAASLANSSAAVPSASDAPSSNLSHLAKEVASASDMATPSGMPLLRQKGRVTGYPLPRFASLKSDKVRMRAGPSTDYPIRYVYEARGLPVEIIEEYDSWRQVRDSDGTSGWMSAVMLSGTRTGLAAPWHGTKGDLVVLHDRPIGTSGVRAQLQPRVRLQINSCDGHWCSVAVQHGGPSGYIKQGLIWGVYPGEIIGR